MTTTVRPRSKSYWIGLGVPVDQLTLVARREDGVLLYVPSWPQFLPESMEKVKKGPALRSPALSDAETALLRFIATQRGI